MAKKTLTQHGRRLFLKRPVIGIPFNYDESWIGGTYYIKNLISSLNLISPSEQPDVWIISHLEKSFDFIRSSTGYHRLNWIKPSMIEGANENISRKDKFISWLTPNFCKKRICFDLIYPYPIDTKFKQTACWIPDFQDKHLPNFFSSDELEAREKQHRFYFNNFRHVVFSSNAARRDFEEFYPEANISKHVIHFATFELPNASENNDEILNKYNLPKHFFYCPNQFWIHKNHNIVIDAVKILKDKGINIVVAFSGKEHDHRAPDHYNKLRIKVEDLKLNNNIHFLGFIPRDDQMDIFRRARCIIQPSLFEGWSTAIEDAKSVSQYVIASNIPANIEQSIENIEFFDATDSKALAELLEKYASTTPDRKNINYKKYQHEFATTFMNLVHFVINQKKY